MNAEIEKLYEELRLATKEVVREQGVTYVNLDAHFGPWSAGMRQFFLTYFALESALAPKPQPKGLAEWRAEYYPIDAKDVPKEKAGRHAHKKWTGLRPAILAEYGLAIRGWQLWGTGGGIFSVSVDTCSLCTHYREPHGGCPGCPKCPLTTTATALLYAHWTNSRDPEPMIAALAKVAAAEEAAEKKAKEPQPKVGQWGRLQGGVEAQPIVKVDVATGCCWWADGRCRNSADLEPCAPDWRVMHPAGPPVPGSKVEVVKHPVEADGQGFNVSDALAAGKTLVVLGTEACDRLAPAGPWSIVVRALDSRDHWHIWPWNCRPLSEDAK